MDAAPDRTRLQLLAALAASALPAATISSSSNALAAATVATPPQGVAAPDAGLIHLNTASLGITPPAVLERTLRAWLEIERNPVLMSYNLQTGTVGQADAVRGRAAALMNCDADEVLITRSTTEGMNTLALVLQLRRGDRVLTTAHEHHGGSAGWGFRARRDGVLLDQVEIGFDDHDPGAIVQRFADAIRPRTRAISVSHVLTTNGLRMPIAEIASMARRRGVLCIVDGAQAAGGIAVDVRALGCDAYATSGHKWLMGPKGTGLLYIRRDASDALAPAQWESGRLYSANSAGVGAIPLVVGLGSAIDALLAIGMDEVERRNIALRDYAEQSLAQLTQLKRVGPPQGSQSSPLLAYRLPDAIDSIALRLHLAERHRIVVKSVEKQWFNGIRISPHVINSKADIDALYGALRSEFG